MSYWINYNNDKNIKGIINKENPIIPFHNQEQYEVLYETDIDNIYIFLKNNYNIYYSKTYIEDFLTKDKENFFLKLLFKGDIIGTISAEYIPLNIGKSFIINHLCIRKDNRDKNLCLILINYITKLIFSKGILFSIFSTENDRLNKYIKPLSIKTNYVVFRNIIKKKSYQIKLFDKNDLTSKHKEIIYNKYLEKYKHYDVYYKFSDYNSFFDFFSCDLLLYDVEFNYVFLKFNIARNLKRYFVSCYYIDTKNKTFISRLMNSSILKDCDILHFNDTNIENKKLIRLDAKLYYYIYNYNINKEIIKDNIFIT